MSTVGIKKRRKYGIASHRSAKDHGSDLLFRIMAASHNLHVCYLKIGKEKDHPCQKTGAYSSHNICFCFFERFDFFLYLDVRIKIKFLYTLLSGRPSRKRSSQICSYPLWIKEQPQTCVSPSAARAATIKAAPPRNSLAFTGHPLRRIPSV